MFEDILKEDRTVKCVVTGKNRFLLDGENQCSNFYEFEGDIPNSKTYGCRKYLTEIDIPNKGWCYE